MIPFVGQALYQYGAHCSGGELLGAQSRAPFSSSHTAGLSVRCCSSIVCRGSCRGSRRVTGVVRPMSCGVGCRASCRYHVGDVEIRRRPTREAGDKLVGHALGLDWTNAESRH